MLPNRMDTTILDATTACSNINGHLLGLATNSKPECVNASETTDSHTAITDVDLDAGKHC